MTDIVASLEQQDLETEFSFAEALVREAGGLTRDYIVNGYGIKWKKDNTPVTDIDRAINKLVINRIRERNPDDRVYGEEESADGVGLHTWVLDPIDGTQSLGIVPTFTILLARLDARGRTDFGLAYDPTADKLYAVKKDGETTCNGQVLRVSKKDTIKSSYVYFGSRMPDGVATNGQIYDRLEGQGAKVFNTRSLGYGCLMVAEGRVEGAFIGVSTPFEAATVCQMVERAGGVVTDLHGKPLDRLDGEIAGAIVSNGKIHQQLVEAVRAA